MCIVSLNCFFSQWRSKPSSAKAIVELPFSPVFVFWIHLPGKKLKPVTIWKTDDYIPWEIIALLFHRRRNFYAYVYFVHFSLGAMLNRHHILSYPWKLQHTINIENSCTQIYWNVIRCLFCAGAYMSVVHFTVSRSNLGIFYIAHHNLEREKTSARENGRNMKNFIKMSSFLQHHTERWNWQFKLPLESHQNKTYIHSRTIHQRIAVVCLP